MKTKRAWIITGALLTVPLAVVPVAAEQEAKASKATEAFERREAAMKELAADSKRILGTLEGLTREQKNAVVALMAVSRAAAAYESRMPRKGDAALRELYGALRPFTPAYTAPGKFQGLMGACFGASVSCLGARKGCLDGGKKEDQCDRDPKVVESCANEAICFTDWFSKLHQGIPEILGGRDPWPPEPFPY